MAKTWRSPALTDRGSVTDATVRAGSSDTVSWNSEAAMGQLTPHWQLR
jgi:hypothetical protein